MIDFVSWPPFISNDGTKRGGQVINSTIVVKDPVYHRIFDKQLNFLDLRS